MKVISTETIHFPSLNWGITAGETRELPADLEAQKVILAHPAISEVKGGEAKKSKPDTDEQK